jgi:hypothetical protein
MFLILILNDDSAKHPYRDSSFNQVFSIEFFIENEEKVKELLFEDDIEQIAAMFLENEKMMRFKLIARIGEYNQHQLSFSEWKQLSLMNFELEGLKI